MNATMTQNVVTYTVVVTTDNSSGKLLPYLTANVQFEVDQPLRRAAGAQRGVAVEAAGLADRPGGAQGRQRRPPGRPAAEDRGRLWVAAGRRLRPAVGGRGRASPTEP